MFIIPSSFLLGTLAVLLFLFLLVELLVLNDHPSDPESDHGPEVIPEVVWNHVPGLSLDEIGDSRLGREAADDQRQGSDSEVGAAEGGRPDEDVLVAFDRENADDGGREEDDGPHDDLR